MNPQTGASYLEPGLEEPVHLVLAVDEVAQTECPPITGMSHWMQSCRNALAAQPLCADSEVSLELHEDISTRLQPGLLGNAIPGWPSSSTLQLPNSNLRCWAKCQPPERSQPDSVAHQAASEKAADAMADALDQKLQNSPGKS